MHLPRGLAGLTSLLSLSLSPRQDFDSDSHPYTDSLTGLKFASYISDRNIAFRVAIPSGVTAGKEFDAVLQITAPKATGWAGFAWGGTMTYNPLAIAWANGDNVVLSSRIAYGYYSPPPYEPAKYTVLKTGSFVNATHFQVTAVCKGCSKWGDDDIGFTELDPTVDVPFGFAFSNNHVDDPSNVESPFGIHESIGHPIFNLQVAKNDDFEAKIAKL